MTITKITMKEGYTIDDYYKDGKPFDKEGSILGTEIKDGKLILIIDANKSKLLVGKVHQKKPL